MLAYTRPNQLWWQKSHPARRPTPIHGFGVWRNKKGYPVVTALTPAFFLDDKRPALIQRFKDLPSASAYARELGTLVKPDPKPWRSR